MFQPHTPPPAEYAPLPPPRDPMSARLAHLQQLGELKAKGILSEAEFQTQKELILNS